MKICKIVFFAAFLASFTYVPKTVQKLSYEQLEKMVKKANDTLYIVNYWATWCKPCVEEMPYFIESAKKNASSKVKFIFVSLNSLKETEKVNQFVEKRQIEQNVFLLNAGNPNVWIDKVDPSWGGSIPATVMYKKKKKIFFREGGFTQTELDSVINLNLNIK